MSETLRPMTTYRLLALVREAGHEAVRVQDEPRTWNALVTTSAGETLRVCRLTGRITTA